MGKKVAHSSESGRSYRLDRLIGKGGFGEVYLATPTPAGGLPAQVCIKISTRLKAWLREAYFAELLEREPRALRIYDRFAEADGSAMRYCLAMEYAEHGDLGAWLGRRGPQPERFVRREIAANPGRARHAASRPGAAPRSHAVQRVRVRERAAEAGRFRHPASRSAIVSPPGSARRTSPSCSSKSRARCACSTGSPRSMVTACVTAW